VDLGLIPHLRDDAIVRCVVDDVYRIVTKRTRGSFVRP